MTATMMLIAALLGVEVNSNDARFAAKVKRVAERQVKVRGLEFKEPIDVNVLTVAELKSMLTKKLRDELTPREVERQRLVLGKLGLIPMRTDLHRLYLELFGEQIAGMYDPDDKKLFLIRSDGSAFAEQDDIIIAHELTHALQDQHFNIKELTQRYEGEDDCSAAVLAVIEGDATVAMMEYMIAEGGAGGMRAFIVRKMTDFLMGNIELLMKLAGGLGQDAFGRAPNFIRAQLLFSYSAGLRFVRYGMSSKNWAAINRTLAAPPLSTEQIMHPRKFFRDPDWPTYICTPGIGVLLPGKWHMAARAVMGELGTKTVLEEHRPRCQPAAEGEDPPPQLPSPRAAARGWDGDEVNVYRNWERPDDLLLVWYSTWDTEKDAEEFERALAAWVEKRYPNARPVEGRPRRWAFGMLLISIERRGSNVLLIDGLHGDCHDEIADAILHKTWRKEMRPGKNPVQLDGNYMPDQHHTP